MGEIVTIANQKGGVGKTTTVVNLAYSLSLLKKRVLIFDLDPQGNATSGIGVKIKDDNLTSYNVIVGDCEVEDAIIDLTHLEIVPANINLAGASVELLNLNDREFKLKNSINKVKNDFDYILIDTPPSLGLLTINALVASDSFLIPVQCEYYALEGLTQLLKTIKIVQDRYNQDLKLRSSSYNVCSKNKSFKAS